MAIFRRKRKKSYGKSYGAKRGPGSRRMYKRRKRSYKSKRAGAVTSLPRGLIAQKSYVRLRFATSVTITPVSAGVLGAHTFRANSLYDPDQTGVGTVVPGYTHMFEKYDHCTVVGARIVCDFECTNTSGDHTILMGIIPTDGGSLDASVADANGFRIARRSVYKHMKHGNGESSPMRRIKYNLDIAKFNGIPRSIVGDSRYAHQAGSNPSEQTYFQVVAGALDDAETSIPTTRVAVYMEFRCVFTEPKEVILS